MTPLELFGDLQNLPWVAELRRSRWAYPLVNTGHIAGLALLFGAIVPLDLRLLGLWRSVRLTELARVLLPVAVAGFAIAVVMGALLFAVRAEKYASLPLFQLKMILIVCALANALVLHFSTAWARAGAGTDAAPAWRLRLAAVLSIGLWSSVIICGRMLGYMD